VGVAGENISNVVRVGLDEIEVDCTAGTWFLFKE